MPQKPNWVRHAPGSRPDSVARHKKPFSCLGMDHVQAFVFLRLPSLIVAVFWHWVHHEDDICQEAHSLAHRPGPSRAQRSNRTHWLCQQRPRSSMRLPWPRLTSKLARNRWSFGIRISRNENFLAKLTAWRCESCRESSVRRGQCACRRVRVHRRPSRCRAYAQSRSGGSASPRPCIRAARSPRAAP
jgi:hypothetical protein